ncbi:hypothetical protein SAMN05192575_101359 [Nocardioides alpinus]|uniref:Uncharacterized protein n=1 Tax=Nocardioides alpinus TaxID=748909 RepID=A0A1I0VR88_9ACTN|nr:hypothetical protein [Nocardioides alpinus]PKH37390.1 hypothetical protein CXG46_18200 [Nocardioides alpinus]SFA78196.1 hypothetical protein SAMN05192575_101359 [Nocardioides alpinus]
MRTTLSGATLALAALVLSPLAPAHADGIGVLDPQDLGHGVDLRSVTVDHRSKNVVVTTTHTDLVESFRSGSSGSVFLDTDPTDPGPEYVFAGGYFVGTDYALLTTDGFATKKWGEPVEGSYRMRIDYDADQVRMRMSREVLGSPEQVRVAVRVAGTRPDGRNTRTDWLGDPRSLTAWVPAPVEQGRAT